LERNFGFAEDEDCYSETMKLANQTLEATAAAPVIMTVTDKRTSSASAPPLVSGCASALRSAKR
jgi:hypothetical protein